MQIRDRKKPGQQSPQKSDLGTSWAPFGRVWGKFWEGFGGSWGFFGSFWKLFFSCLYVEWSSKVLLELSGLDFGSILMDDGKRRLRSLKLVPALQGPNRGESLRGGISRDALGSLGGLGGFPLMLAHFSLLWLIFSNDGKRALAQLGVDASPPRA